jgi:TetR/AcrR family transcriptional regulator, mexJK operon transcriptional repressor
MSRSPSPARGRPKDIAKKAAILQAAMELFPHYGLAGVSMEQLAKAANVSKITLYSHFENKEDLFCATIGTKCQMHLPDTHFEPEPDLKKALLRLGDGFIQLILSSEAQGLHRLMVAEGAKVKGMSEMFWQAGPERVIAAMAVLLQNYPATKNLNESARREAAINFFSLLKGTLFDRVLLGLERPPTAGIRKKHVEGAVAAFLKLYSADRL